jgi:hypothetical protein
MDQFNMFSVSEKRLFAFWNAKREGRLMPSRADFVAEELSEWIGWMHLLRPVDDGVDFIYEVFSTRSFIGTPREMTGRRVGSWNDGRVEVALEFYRAVIRGKSPVLFAAPERFENDFITFRRIALPFGDNGEVTHILAHLNETPIDGSSDRVPVPISVEAIDDILRSGVP